jgi:Asp-tRNA(Asn)/Glu-tRNA(Gln) amidotransferase A subunit family amidase
LPQLTLPVAEAEGCQVGLSILGARDTDRALLETARWWLSDSRSGART